MKCWNSSYSYTSDGKNSSETFQKSFNDGHRIYEDGYIKTQDKDLNEKFYKKEKQLKNNSEKSLLGKSKNRDDWELLRIKNGHKTYKKQKYNDGTKKLNEYKQYLERPSSRHRLTRHIFEAICCSTHLSSSINKHGNLRITSLHECSMWSSAT